MRKPKARLCPWCLKEICGIGHETFATVSLITGESVIYQAHMGCAIISQIQGSWPDRQKRTGKPHEKDFVADYKRGLALGGTLGLRGLFEGAGLVFDMRESAIRPLVEKVREEWETSIGIRG